VNAHAGPPKLRFRSTPAGPSVYNAGRRCANRERCDMRRLSNGPCDAQHTASAVHTAKPVQVGLRRAVLKPKAAVRKIRKESTARCRAGPAGHLRGMWVLGTHRDGLCRFFRVNNDHILRNKPHARSTRHLRTRSSACFCATADCRRVHTYASTAHQVAWHVCNVMQHVPAPGLAGEHS
jgi:hypothetical protein